MPTNQPNFLYLSLFLILFIYFWLLWKGNKKHILKIFKKIKNWWIKDIFPHMKIDDKHLWTLAARDLAKYIVRSYEYWNPNILRYFFQWEQGLFRINGIILLVLVPKIKFRNLINQNILLLLFVSMFYVSNFLSYVLTLEL